jgi:hypothetical protein
VVFGVAIGVGNNGAMMCFRIIFHNSFNVGKILVGCPTISQSAHGGWMHGGEGRVGSFLVLVPCWLVLFPTL